MFKRALSSIICFIMLISTFVGTGVFASANNELADEILSQTHSEPTEEPIESTSVPEIPVATAEKNNAVVVPDTAKASYSGECGDNLTWSLNTSTGVLNITGSGDMYDYYDGKAPWYSYRSHIKILIVGDSVTSIGDYAFFKSTNLNDITLSDSIISIGYCAFDSTAYYDNTNNWENKVLYIGKNLIRAKPNFVGECIVKTGTTCIADSAFYFCEALTSVTIPDSVISIGHKAFYNCTVLISATVGNSVTTIGEWTFYNCKSLISMTIPDSVTSIGECAFYSCDSLSSVTIGNSVSSIGSSAFSDCSSLTNVYISDIAVWCGIKFSNYLSNPLYSAKNLYHNGVLVTDLVIPDSVTNIGSYAFYYCESLTSISIPDSVTSIGSSAFSGTAYYNNSSNWVNNVLYIGNHLIKAKSSFSGSYSIMDGTLTIANYAFSSCESLTSISIPDSVTSIGDYAFNKCSSLASVTIGNSVTNIGGYAFADCASLASVTIGNSVTSIGADAFYNCDSLSSVTIPDSVTSVGDEAFYECYSLTSVTIGNSVTSIGERAFHYYSNYSYYKLNVTVKCYENSYAHTYAVENGFKYELICNHSFTNYISDGNATCNEDGTMTAYCDFGCGAIDTVVDEGSALGHTWSEWIVTIEPTYTAEGKQIRFCFVCDAGETEILPMLSSPNKPVITVDNFKVTITNADYIKDMRYAPGVYTTTTEIRNAEGNVAISESLVVKNTLDGSFVYEMPNAGYFTIWIRMKDGTNHILPLDVTKVTPSISTYGVKITLHNLYNVKDFYIAKGEYQTYREIKDNGYIVSITGVKIGTKHDYTYTVYEPGVHTILVRYNDGSQALFHETLVVDEPVFTTNGLQVTVSNLPDVKVIRTAYGEWNSVKELKATDTLRNFSAKTAIKGKDPYTIQYREDGMVTVIVEYNNGYQKVFHYNVQHKQASCTVTGDTVLLRNLDGMVMIRYAVGEYTSSADIKRAPGSKYLKPADLTNGYAIVSGLAKGTYTFCVQFDDDSYNYFTVTVK